jgi:hypothetical protein
MMEGADDKDGEKKMSEDVRVRKMQHAVETKFTEHARALRVKDCSRVYMSNLHVSTVRESRRLRGVRFSFEGA